MKYQENLKKKGSNGFRKLISSFVYVSSSSQINKKSAKAENLEKKEKNKKEDPDVENWNIS